MTRPIGPVLLITAEAVLVVCWSGGYVGYSVAADHAPVFQVSFWRFLITALVLSPFALPVVLRLPLRTIARQGLIGVLAVAVYMASIVKAMELGVPTGLAALAGDLLPLVVMLAAIPYRGEWPTRAQWLGTALAVLGVLVVTADALRLGDAPIWTYGLPVLGVMAVAVATFMQKNGAEPDLPLTVILFLHTASAACIFALLSGIEGGLVPEPSPGVLLSVAWLVMVPTIGGYGLYWLCLRLTSPTRVTSVLYLSPPVTMLWAWAMLGEPLTLAMGTGLAVTLAGLILINRRSGIEPCQPLGPMRSADSVRPIQACTEG